MAGEAAPAVTTNRLRPDGELLAALLGSGGEDLKKCIQCATCSAVCELADARHPGPRKEMLWAGWGLRERLMGDPDPWLCHQCGDCTLRCPRSARPGDVMAALRRECVVHYGTPRAFGRWLNQPRSLPWVLLLAALVLAAAAAVWHAAGAGAAEMSTTGPRTVMPFWSELPQWFLGSVFTLLLLWDVLVLARSGRRFWRDMQAQAPAAGTVRPLGASLGAAFRRIVWHEDFGLCAQSRGRRTSHLLVVYGMLALWLVSLWVVSARWNPLLDGLVYPLGFWNPWKLLANLAGLAVAVGAMLMLVERTERPATGGATRYADGALLGLLLTIVLTGFASELTHFLRIEPLRFAAYALHLVAVFALLGMLPYTKLAHVLYRTLALVHAERIGRGPKRGPS